MLNVMGGTAGQFVPQEGAQPAIGQVGTPERVEEDRVEVVVHASADPASGTGAGEGADGGVEMHRVLEELKKVRALSLRVEAILTTPNRCIHTRRWRTTCTNWSRSRVRRRPRGALSASSLQPVPGTLCRYAATNRTPFAREPNPGAAPRSCCVRQCPIWWLLWRRPGRLTIHVSLFTRDAVSTRAPCGPVRLLSW